MIPDEVQGHPAARSGAQRIQAVTRRLTLQRPLLETAERAPDQAKTSRSRAVD